MPTAAAAWTSFLQDGRAQADAAVAELETSLEQAAARFEARYAAIQELYVTARRDRQSVAEYARALEAAGVGQTAFSAPASRVVIAGLFETDVPIPGTSTYSAARDWLSRLAEAEGVPTARLSAAVESLQRAMGSLPESEAVAVASSVPIPSDSLPEDVSVVDRAVEAVSVWELRVLAAESPRRVRLLEQMSASLVGLDGGSDRGIRRELDAIADELRELIRLERLLPVGADAFAQVFAPVFADASRLGSPAGLTEVFGTLSALAGAGARQAATTYSLHPELAFLVDTAGSLLGAASELQRFDVASAAGMPIGRLRAIAPYLWRLRREARSMPVRPAMEAADARAEAFATFVSEGTDYVSAATPWAEGRSSRTGDEYRWAMLPILSHPYAQFLVATEPELSDTRAMVDGFAISIYEDAFRRTGRFAEELGPVVVGDHNAPYQRMYESEVGDAATALYDAFAAAAQGTEQLGRDFAVPFASGLSLAGYWSHIHGLHVAVLDGRRRADVSAVLRSRVDAWFALARASDTDQDELALTTRGLMALRRAVLDEIEPLASASGAPGAVGLIAPRLPLVIALLDEAAGFRVDALTVRDALADIYAADADALTDAIAADLVSFADRMRDVEIPDRRLLSRASAGVPE